MYIPRNANRLFTAHTYSNKGQQIRRMRNHGYDIPNKSENQMNKFVIEKLNDSVEANTDKLPASFQSLHLSPEQLEDYEKKINEVVQATFDKMMQNVVSKEQYKKDLAGLMDPSKNNEDVKLFLKEIQNKLDQISRLETPTSEDLDLKQFCEGLKEECNKFLSENKGKSDNITIRELLKKQFDKINPTTTSGKTAYFAMFIFLVSGTLTDYLLEKAIEKAFGDPDNPEILLEMEDSIKGPIENMQDGLDQAQLRGYHPTREILTEKHDLEKKSEALLKEIATLKHAIASEGPDGEFRETEDKMKSALKIRNVNKKKYKEQYEDYLNPKALCLKIDVTHVKMSGVRKASAFFGGLLLSQHEITRQIKELNEDVSAFNKKLEEEEKTFTNKKIKPGE